MPDSNGFDHLVNRGTVELRCIWCSERAPAGSSESTLSRHANKHRRDAERALEVSREEAAKIAQAVA